MTKLTDPNGDWALAVGRVMIAFGSIEHVVVACIKHIPSEPIFESASKLQFSQRVALLLEVLSVREADVFVRLVGLLRQAVTLAHTRNLLAHNPLTLQIYESEGEYTFKHVIASLKKETVITLPEVKRCAESAEQLASDLYTASKAVFQRLDR